MRVRVGVFLKYTRRQCWEIIASFIGYYEIALENGSKFVPQKRLKIVPHCSSTQLRPCSLKRSLKPAFISIKRVEGIILKWFCIIMISGATTDG